MEEQGQIPRQRRPGEQVSGDKDKTPWRFRSEAARRDDGLKLNQQLQNAGRTMSLIRACSNTTRAVRADAMHRRVPHA